MDEKFEGQQKLLDVANQLQRSVLEQREHIGTNSATHRPIRDALDGALKALPKLPDGAPKHPLTDLRHQFIDLNMHADSMAPVDRTATKTQHGDEALIDGPFVYKDVPPNEALTKLLSSRDNDQTVSGNLQAAAKIVSGIRKYSEGDDALIKMTEQQRQYFDQFAAAVGKIEQPARQFNQALVSTDPNPLTARIGEIVNDEQLPAHLQEVAKGLNTGFDVMIKVATAADSKTELALKMAAVADLEAAIARLKTADGEKTFAKILEEKIPLAKTDPRWEVACTDAQKLAPERFNGTSKTVLSILAGATQTTGQLNDLFEQTGSMHRLPPDRSVQWERGVARSEPDKKPAQWERAVPPSPELTAASTALEHFGSQINLVANVLSARGKCLALAG